MDYRFFIARRYLVSRKRVTLISTITAISTVGVAVGVAALIVVLSVMNGFFDFVRDLLVSVDPHVRIESAEGGGVGNPDSLAAVALEIDGVVGASSFVQGKALVSTGNQMDAGKVVLVRGVDPEVFESTEGLASGFGSFEMDRRGGLPGIVIGGDLARRFGLTPETSALEASRIGLLSAQSLERSITNPFSGLLIPRFEVRGVFDLESVSDESRVYISIEEAQRIFRLGRRVSGVELRIADLEQAAAIKTRLASALPSRYRVRTWYDLQESLYGVMKLEKWAATLILALIIVVAAFNIAASITMVVIEKRRDIGVLQAMGMAKADIGRIFRIEGLLIGLIGTGVGLVVGLGLAYLQKHFELVPLVGADSFLLSAYPVAVRFVDVAVVSVIGLMLCVAASLYPARRAAAVEPAEAVHIDG
ncbi:MAG: ABC transporter permease [Rhodothermia bacterium]|nr:ABC transporter permease [Rhodothermia bacterium]